MKNKASLSTNISRRAMLKTASAAATGIAFGLKSASAVAQCQPPAHPVEYDPANNPLNDTNIAPLFAAWLILTTNSPDVPTQQLLQEVAGVGPNTATALMTVYNSCQSSLTEVRKAFGVVAYSFAANSSPYSGGQCPEKIDTIGPVSKVNTSPWALITNCGHLPTDSPIQYPSCIPQPMKDNVEKKLAAKQKQSRQ